MLRIDEDEGLHTARLARRRLTFAMGVSSAIMLALLMLPLEFSRCSTSSCIDEKEEPVTVYLIDRAVVQNSNSSNDTMSTPELANDNADSAEPIAPEAQEPQSESRTVDAASPLATPKRDWTAVVTRSIKGSTDERLRLEEAEKSRWQKSRSVMFQPGAGFATNNIEPVLLDIKFKRHVVGLGIRVGYCFIGIPIAGVPVEERTVAITLFVCGHDT